MYALTIAHIIHELPSLIHCPFPFATKDYH